MTGQLEYQAAVQRAEAKKASFLANAQLARARISPSRLKDDAKASVQDVWENGTEKTREAAREHPLAVGAAGVGLTAYIFRRPLYRWAKRLVSRLNRPSEPDILPIHTQIGIWLKEKMHSAAQAARIEGDSHEK